MNAIYSYLFNVEISDQPILAKNSKKGLTYGELRILSFLRNPLFNIEEFQKREILLDNGQNEHTVDYSIMRVIEIFYSFVKEPVRIDNLIVTHKYICDVWKNGSKHLYFYTLHNQEHAIVLIQNIVKLINTIDFLKISSIDYYILFLACYLHDNDENSLSSVLAIAYLSAMQYYFKPIQELPTGRGEEALQTSYFFLSQSIGTIILHLSLN